MTQYDKVNDSGKRQEFKTGSVRDTNIGKGRYDLISPIALQRLAKHFENGAVKYGDRNWEKGQPLSRYFDSAVRHLYRFLEGLRDEDHLAAALWNVGAMIHTEELIERNLLPKELNDLPNYLKKDERPFIVKGNNLITALPHFIIDGRCKNESGDICNLGYACDACPYNKGDINHE
jgi:hypothetical protein